MVCGYLGTMNFFVSQQGKVKVEFEGYVYVKQKNLVNGVVSYECEKRRKTSQCKAKIKILGKELVGRINIHSHDPEPPTWKVLNIVQQIKTEPENSDETSTQQITQSLLHISENARTQFPTIHDIRRNRRRRRQAVSNVEVSTTSSTKRCKMRIIKTAHDCKDFVLFG